MVNKSLCIGILALGLLLGFASISLADEMGGMNMGGSASPQTTPNTQPQDSKATDTQPQTQQENSTMPGMESDGEGTSQGVNWFVVGGFLTVNLLTIGTAGVLKFTKSIPTQQ